MLHYSATYVDREERQQRLIGQEWDVVVDVPSPDRVEPRHLHAVVSSWFDLGSSPFVDGEQPRWSADLAGVQAHGDSSKPYAIGPIWQRPDGRSGFSLRVLGGALEPRIAEQPVRLGKQQAMIEWRSAALLRQSSVDDLLALPSVESVLVRFETPVTRRRRDTYHPVPSEQSILSSWERSAATIGLGGAVDWGPVPAAIIHLNGHTASWPAPKARSRRQDPVGFVGDVGIAVPPVYGRRLHQLATLAAFAGTGSHTTFGMGFTTLMAVEELSS